MDRSKEYILMCEKAVEIQKEKPDTGDSSAQFFVCEICGRFYTEDNGFNWCTLHIDESKNPTWLPRQDQLQKMIGKQYYTTTLIQFYSWWKNFKTFKAFSSMEQLWLAFVMKEKYNKVWTGKEWANGQKEGKK